MQLSAHRRPGYIFLITVLVIGAIASTAATSLVLVGIARQQNSLAATQSAQAYEFARTCIERGIRALRTDLSYDGGFSAVFSEGSCTLSHLAGTGNADRILCAEGHSANAVRRLEVTLQRVLPTTAVDSWTEVSDFTGACP